MKANLLIVSHPVSVTQDVAGPRSPNEAGVPAELVGVAPVLVYLMLLVSIAMEADVAGRVTQDRTVDLETAFVAPPIWRFSPD